MYKSHEISKKYQLNLNGIRNISVFKYILCSIFFMENTEKVLSAFQTNSENRNSNGNVKKNKKTNIKIDFDFSKVIEMLT